VGDYVAEMQNLIGRRREMGFGDKLDVTTTPPRVLSESELHFLNLFYKLGSA